MRFSPQQLTEAIEAQEPQMLRLLGVKFDHRGFQAPGCELDLEHPGMRALAGAYAAINGAPPRRLAMTATTGARRRGH